MAASYKGKVVVIEVRFFKGEEKIFVNNQPTVTTPHKLMTELLATHQLTQHSQSSLVLQQTDWKGGLESLPMFTCIYILYPRMPPSAE